MITIKTETNVNKCNECPYHITKPQYTIDSWEHPEGYFCSKKDNRPIAEYIEWESELPPIPEWCPFKNKKEDINMNTYERIFRNHIDEIIEKSNGADITYIRDGERSCDDLDIICDFLDKGYSYTLRQEKGKFGIRKIIITFHKE